MRSSEGPIRVLIVDDSATMRAMMRALLSSHDDIDIVGEAEDGAAAVDLAAAVAPEVITMDVLMPGLDGIATIGRLMATAPTRILVVSSAVGGGGAKSEEAAALSMRAIAAGALEVFAKPTATSGDPRRFGDDLAEAIRLMAEVPVVRRRRPIALPLTPTPLPRARPVDVVAVAASTGGPPVLAALIARLRGKNAPPVLVAQHLAEGFTAGLARWLEDTTGVRVCVAVDGGAVERGVVYVAADGRDIVVDDRLRLASPTPSSAHRPSADRLLSSVAAARGKNAIGVVLTGMGDDGARGLLDIHRAGGLTLVQDPASAVVGGMPGAAIGLVGGAHVLSVDELGAALVTLSGR